MPQWTRSLFGAKRIRLQDQAMRAELAARTQEDPQAWGYLACRQDDATCATCLRAAGTLRHVRLNDPRLLIMLRGHPDCTSPEGCRCEVTIVGGDEYDPDA
jgi:hypothetical protein